MKGVAVLFILGLLVMVVWSFIYSLVLGARLNSVSRQLDRLKARVSDSNRATSAVESPRGSRPLVDHPESIASGAAGLAPPGAEARSTVERLTEAKRSASEATFAKSGAASPDAQPARSAPEAQNPPEKQALDELDTHATTAGSTETPGAPRALEETTSPPSDPAALEPSPARPGLAASRTVEPPSTATPTAPSTTNLEHLIGERWLNWVGTFTLLVGVSLFLKYAYDNAWIGPLGRMLIAYAFGVAALFAGGSLRKRLHTVVGDGVTAIGLGSMYAATYFGTSIYRFDWMPTPLAFSITGIITAVGVLLAWRRRSEFLGVLAFVGGYMSPAILSTGTDHGEVLVTYLSVLAVGAAALGHQLGWRSVLWIAIIGCYWLFLGWFVSHYSPARLSIGVAGPISFLLIFSLGSVGPALMTRRPGAPLDVGAMVLTAVCSFIFAYATLRNSHSLPLVWGCLGTAIYFGAMNRGLAARCGSQTPLAVATLLLSVLFVTIAIPIYFDLWGVPIAWSIEGLILTVLARRFRNAWHLGAATVALALACLYLLARVDSRVLEIDIVLTDSFGTWSLTIAVLFASAWIMLAHRNSSANASPPDSRELGHASSWRGTTATFGVVAYTVGAVGGFVLILTEILGPVTPRLAYRTDSVVLTLLLCAFMPYSFVVAAGLTRDATRRAFQGLSLFAGFAGAPAFLSLLALYRTDWEHGGPLWPILHPWFGAGLSWVFTLAILAAHYRRQVGWLTTAFGASAVTVLWLLLSRECFEFFYQLRGADSIGQQWGLTSLSVLWAVYASGLLAIGVRWRNQGFRWSALALFGVTAGKVFLLDTTDLKAVYRILAFVCLGVLLVMASLVYSRLARREEQVVGSSEGQTPPSPPSPD